MGEDGKRKRQTLESTSITTTPVNDSIPEYDLLAMINPTESKQTLLRSKKNETRKNKKAFPTQSMSKSESELRSEYECATQASQVLRNLNKACSIRI